MIERLAITLALIIMSTGALMAFRRRHMRQTSRMLRPLPVKTGRPVLLYFRSDHCGPCLTQAHYLQTVKKTFGKRLSVQEVNADVEGNEATRYGVFTLPTTLIVDREGQVRHINYGLTPAGKLTQQVEKVV